MKKFNSVLVVIALLIIGSVMVPFTKDSIGVNEVLIKFAVCAGLAFLIAVIGCVGKDKKVEGKKGFYAAALILSAYIASVFAYLFFYVLRSSASIVYLAFTFGAALVFTIFALSLPKYEHRKALFMPLAVFFVIAAAGAYVYANSKVDEILKSNIELAFYASIALAAFTTLFYIIEYFIMTKKLSETHMERDVVLYQEIMDDNLKDIYDYSKNELQNRGIVFEETKVEVVKEIPVEKIIDREVIREVPIEKVVEKEVEVVKEVPIPQYVEKEVIKEIPVIKEVEVVKEVPVVKEVEKVVEKVVEVIKEVPVEKEVEKVVIKEIPVEKIVEVVKEVPVDKVVQVVKEIPVEHVVEVEKAKKAAKPKVKVIIKPSPSDIALKAEKLYKDIEIVYGKDDETFKIFRNKRLVMMVNGGSTSYKVTFQRKPISVTSLMNKYPDSCQKASSPEGIQWFKMINKGNIEQADIFSLIKFSYDYTVEAENIETAKKEREAARAAAKKAKEAEAKAKEKEKLAKEKAAQKAKEAEEKAAIKAKEAEERAKAREEAKKAAAEERARQRAIAKEQAKLAKEQALVEAQNAEVVEATPIEVTPIEVAQEPVTPAEGSYVHTVTTTTITQTVETVEASGADLNKEAIKAALREVLAENKEDK